MRIHKNYRQRIKYSPNHKATELTFIQHEKYSQERRNF